LFPGVAEAADGFAEADGEVDDDLQALGVHSAEALAVGQQQLGVAQDARERIIDFVAENGADVFRKLGPRRPDQRIRFSAQRRRRSIRLATTGA
jgi:hypothetical protein